MGKRQTMILQKKHENSHSIQDVKMRKGRKIGTVFLKMKTEETKKVGAILRKTLLLLLFWMSNFYQNFLKIGWC